MPGANRCPGRFPTPSWYARERLDDARSRPPSANSWELGSPIPLSSARRIGRFGPRVHELGVRRVAFNGAFSAPKVWFQTASPVGIAHPFALSEAAPGFGFRLDACLGSPTQAASYALRRYAWSATNPLAWLDAFGRRPAAQPPIRPSALDGDSRGAARIGYDSSPQKARSQRLRAGSSFMF